MSLGREYQINLHTSLNLDRNTPSDIALFQYLERQSRIRSLLESEIKLKEKRIVLDEYSFNVEWGTFLPELAVSSQSTEVVGGSIVRLSSIDIEANNLVIASRVGDERDVEIDLATASDAQLELIQRIANPVGESIESYPVAAGMFGLDRINLARSGTIIKMGRAISLLEALRTDSLLEIGFEMWRIPAEKLPKHGLLTPPIPMRHPSISLPESAMRILRAQT